MYKHISKIIISCLLFCTACDDKDSAIGTDDGSCEDIVSKICYKDSDCDGFFQTEVEIDLNNCNDEICSSYTFDDCGSDLAYRSVTDDGPPYEVGEKIYPDDQITENPFCYPPEVENTKFSFSKHTGKVFMIEMSASW
ncbi:uncharacterized protein METZ01_LOCUS293078 [marine metagenome]|uniref:Uncharacterized protein n=1 Tax=marine metagenome TaxID=408172 RepID=A0A382LU15_9ZZZZ